MASHEEAKETRDVIAGGMAKWDIKAGVTLYGTTRMGARQLSALYGIFQTFNEAVDAIDELDATEKAKFKIVTGIETNEEGVEEGFWAFLPTKIVDVADGMPEQRTVASEINFYLQEKCERDWHTNPFKYYKIASEINGTSAEGESEEQGPCLQGNNVFQVAFLFAFNHIFNEILEKYKTVGVTPSADDMQKRRALLVALENMRYAVEVKNREEDSIFSSGRRSGKFITLLNADAVPVSNVLRRRQRGLKNALMTQIEASELAEENDSVEGHLLAIRKTAHQLAKMGPAGFHYVASTKPSLHAANAMDRLLIDAGLNARVAVEKVKPAEHGESKARGAATQQLRVKDYSKHSTYRCEDPAATEMNPTYICVKRRRSLSEKKLAAAKAIRDDVQTLDEFLDTKLRTGASFVLAKAYEHANALREANKNPDSSTLTTADKENLEWAEEWLAKRFEVKARIQERIAGSHQLNIDISEEDLKLAYGTREALLLAEDGITEQDLYDAVEYELIDLEAAKAWHGMTPQYHCKPGLFYYEMVYNQGKWCEQHSLTPGQVSDCLFSSELQQLYDVKMPTKGFFQNDAMTATGLDRRRNRMLVVLESHVNSSLKREPTVSRIAKATRGDAAHMVTSNMVYAASDAEAKDLREAVGESLDDRKHGAQYSTEPQDPYDAAMDGIRQSEAYKKVSVACWARVIPHKEIEEKTVDFDSSEAYKNDLSGHITTSFKPGILGLTDVRIKEGRAPASFAIPAHKVMTGLRQLAEIEERVQRVVLVCEQLICALDTARLDTERFARPLIEAVSSENEAILALMVTAQKNIKKLDDAYSENGNPKSSSLINALVICNNHLRGLTRSLKSKVAEASTAQTKFKRFLGENAAAEIVDAATTARSSILIALAAVNDFKYDRNSTRFRASCMSVFGGLETWYREQLEANCHWLKSEAQLKFDDAKQQVIYKGCPYQCTTTSYEEVKEKIAAALRDRVDVSSFGLRRVKLIWRKDRIIAESLGIASPSGTEFYYTHDDGVIRRYSLAANSSDIRRWYQRAEDNAEIDVTNMGVVYCNGGAPVTEAMLSAVRLGTVSPTSSRGSASPYSVASSHGERPPSPPTLTRVRLETARAAVAVDEVVEPQDVYYVTQSHLQAIQVADGVGTVNCIFGRPVPEEFKASTIFAECCRDDELGGGIIYKVVSRADGAWQASDATGQLRSANFKLDGSACDVIPQGAPTAILKATDGQAYCVPVAIARNYRIKVNEVVAAETKDPDVDYGSISAKDLYTQSAPEVVSAVAARRPVSGEVRAAVSVYYVRKAQLEAASETPLQCVFGRTIPEESKSAVKTVFQSHVRSASRGRSPSIIDAEGESDSEEEENEIYKVTSSSAGGWKIAGADAELEGLEFDLTNTRVLTAQSGDTPAMLTATNGQTFCVKDHALEAWQRAQNLFFVERDGVSPAPVASGTGGTGTAGAPARASSSPRSARMLSAATTMKASDLFVPAPITSRPSIDTSNVGNPQEHKRANSADEARGRTLTPGRVPRRTDGGISSTRAVDALNLVQSGATGAHPTFFSVGGSAARGTGESKHSVEANGVSVDNGVVGDSAPAVNAAQDNGALRGHLYNAMQTWYKGEFLVGCQYKPFLNIEANMAFRLNHLIAVRGLLKVLADFSPEFNDALPKDRDGNVLYDPEIISKDAEGCFEFKAVPAPGRGQCAFFEIRINKERSTHSYRFYADNAPSTSRSLPNVTCVSGSREALATAFMLPEFRDKSKYTAEALFSFLEEQCNQAMRRGCENAFLIPEGAKAFCEQASGLRAFIGTDTETYSSGFDLVSSDLKPSSSVQRATVQLGEEEVETLQSKRYAFKLPVYSQPAFDMADKLSRELRYQASARHRPDDKAQWHFDFDNEVVCENTYTTRTGESKTQTLRYAKYKKRAGDNEAVVFFKAVSNAVDSADALKAGLARLAAIKTAIESIEAKAERGVSPAEADKLAFQVAKADVKPLHTLRAFRQETDNIDFADLLDDCEKEKTCFSESADVLSAAPYSCAGLAAEKASFESQYEELKRYFCRFELAPPVSEGRAAAAETKVEDASLVVVPVTTGAQIFSAASTRAVAKAAEIETARLEDVARQRRDKWLGVKQACEKLQTIVEALHTELAEEKLFCKPDWTSVDAACAVGELKRDDHILAQLQQDTIIEIGTLCTEIANSRRTADAADKSEPSYVEVYGREVEGTRSECLYNTIYTKVEDIQSNLEPLQRVHSAVADFKAYKNEKRLEKLIKAVEKYEGIVAAFDGGPTVEEAIAAFDLAAAHDAEFEHLPVEQLQQERGVTNVFDFYTKLSEQLSDNAVLEARLARSHSKLQDLVGTRVTAAHFWTKGGLRAVYQQTVYRRASASAAVAARIAAARRDTEAARRLDEGEERVFDEQPDAQQHAQIRRSSTGSSDSSVAINGPVVAADAEATESLSLLEAYNRHKSELANSKKYSAANLESIMDAAHTWKLETPGGQAGFMRVLAAYAVYRGERYANKKHYGCCGLFLRAEHKQRGIKASAIDVLAKAFAASKDSRKEVAQGAFEWNDQLETANKSKAELIVKALNDRDMIGSHRLNDLFRASGLQADTNESGNIVFTKATGGSAQVSVTVTLPQNKVAMG